MRFGNIVWRIILRFLLFTSPMVWLWNLEKSWAKSEMMNGKGNRDRWGKNGHIPDLWSGSTMPWSLSSVEHLLSSACREPLPSAWVQLFCCLCFFGLQRWNQKSENNPLQHQPWTLPCLWKKVCYQKWWSSAPVGLLTLQNEFFRVRAANYTLL